MASSSRQAVSTAAEPQRPFTPPHATPEPTTLKAARRPAYVGFLYRAPFATDAYDLGFTTGIREDYRLQADSYRNVDLPVVMLDNEFHNPDPNRYVERFREYEPDIAVLGDAETPEEARDYTQLARDLRNEFPSTTVIIVPKCHEAIEIIDTDFVLGYPLGYSSLHANDYSDPADWRGRNIHLLGGSPPVQYEAIQDLTQPTLTGAPPANIVGMDWNGPAKVAYLGEYWSQEGWQSADHLGIRETVRRSLHEIRAFWQEHGLWPETTPHDVYGDAVTEPQDPVWAATGRNIYEEPGLFAPEDGPAYNPEDPDSDPLEDAIVVEYKNGWTLAYRSKTERDRIEYQEGLTPVNNS